HQPSPRSALDAALERTSLMKPSIATASSLHQHIVKELRAARIARMETARPKFVEAPLLAAGHVVTLAAEPPYVPFAGAASEPFVTMVGPQAASIAFADYTRGRLDVAAAVGRSYWSE